VATVSLQLLLDAYCIVEQQEYIFFPNNMFSCTLISTMRTTSVLIVFKETNNN